MSTIFIILAIIFALATLATLLVGVFGLGTGGAFNQRYGNKLMRCRVLFQGLAIVSLMLAFWTRGG